ncbi:hypothetical protein DFH28DRAFT_1083630 [Melampsora americana]|nr:hypothetical protein DFH28DRAFT_1083630 [Melampsora americana]
MSDQPPPTPNPQLDSESPPNDLQNPPATPITPNTVVWGLSQPITTPVPQLQLISTYPTQQHSFISSPSLQLLCKDTNEAGKTLLDLIVEWLSFMWGDQELRGDVVWMCMESHDTQSTNFTRYCMGIPKKKECAEKCGKYLSANSFSGFTWAGIKQRIDNLETKFCRAEAWRNGTGGGVFVNSNAEQGIEALHSTGQWTIEKEDDIRVSTNQPKVADTALSDILHSKCPYYNTLLPVMGNCPSNKPLFAAETETQPIPYGATKTLDHHEDSLPDTLDPTLESEDQRATSTSIPFQHPAPIQLDGRPLSPINPRPNPPASQSSTHSTTNISRQNSSSSSFLKSIQSSLPSQTDIKEMLENNKASNENQRMMIEKVAGASEGMVNILGARFGFEKQNEKRTVEEEDLTAEAVAMRKAKKAKQDELKIIKNLELARERIDIIAKLAAVNIPYAEAEPMADAVIEGFQK